MSRWTEAERALAEADPELGQWIQRLGPCTLTPRLSDGGLFHALSEAIVSQQLSGKAAATIWSRVVAHFGQPHAPAPRQVLDADLDSLRALGLSRQKATYLQSLAHHVLEVFPPLEELQHEPDDVLIEQLTQVKGIGRWTVQMLLIFDFGRPDVWPTEDLGVQHGVRILRALPDRPNSKAMHALGEHFAPYRSIAAWYMWRIYESAGAAKE